MSRSFKKNPVIHISTKMKYVKRYASKKVRKNADLPKSKSAFFKRIFDSWNIHEYKVYVSKSESEILKKIRRK